MPRLWRNALFQLCVRTWVAISRLESCLFVCFLFLNVLNGFNVSVNIHGRASDSFITKFILF